MPAFLAPLMAFLGPLLAGLFVNLITIVLVYALYRLLLAYSDVLINWMLSKVEGLDLSETTLHLVGLGSWIAEQIELPNLVSLAVSLAVSRFALSMVKGMK